MANLTPTTPGPSSARRLDLAIGQRVRELRVARGMTQSGLADAIGITYQQQFKYEAGINRMSVGRLLAIAAALKVEPAELLAVSGRPEARRPRSERRILMLTQLFRGLPERHQIAVLALVRALVP